MKEREELRNFIMENFPSEAEEKDSSDDDDDDEKEDDK